jgi:hypothetical protein
MLSFKTSKKSYSKELQAKEGLLKYEICSCERFAIEDISEGLAMSIVLGAWNVLNGCNVEL